ncbi:nitrogen assimilation transcription factor nit-4 [Mucor ambiguus]|uniref:Nitrogen assimilation transcription factor nit-4 n=1 Tax=Mucor ambiguus TaxID=91626 RepID=A0A0C9LW53_9FUNG|nr:nitrogen assimilation transcription factor nit-4 [Mucor ambiguus]
MFNGMIPIAPAASSSESKPSDIHRRKRTRAKRSCDLCRKKKTRCDSDVNQPCTKCRLAKTECQFLVEQKKRGPSSGSYVELLENRLVRMEKLLQNIAKEKGQDTADEGEHNSPDMDREIPNLDPRISGLCFLQPPRSEDNEHLETLSGHLSNDSDDEAASPNIICPTKEHTLESDKDCQDIETQMQQLTITDYQRTRYLGASSGVHLLNQELFSTNKKQRIPEEPSWFVQKLNKDEEEHVIIKSKEVLQATLKTGQDGTINRIVLFEDTPHITQEIVDYLVHMYFTRIHHYCPVINKVQFLEQYYYHNPSPPDRYLLFAIALIGITIFKTDITNARVFHLSNQQVDEIEESLKNKAHKLMSIVYKRSMISTVQALMLLSMFMGHGENDDEDTSHWFITGMAIRMAQDLGLHRDCSKWLIPDYEIELRKRIWYGAYLMDRWVAAELGRPISIIDNEFDAELPSPYELNYTSSAQTEETESTPILILEAEEALRENKPVYSAFVYLVTLSQITGQVLVGLHSTRAKPNRHNSLDLVNILDRNLNMWKSSLPRELQVDLSNPSQYFSTAAGVVNMAYGCVLLLLYRPFIRNHSETDDANLAFKALSICTATATNLLGTVEAMERDYFVALPWNMSVYSIFQAAIVFLHNAKGENEFVKEQGRQHLLRCSKVYLGDPYLKNTRGVKVLQSLVMNFDVQMDDSSSYRSSTNSPVLDPHMSMRASERNDSDENDDAEHNSFLVKNMIDLHRYNSTLESPPNARSASTFTVTTGQIPESQSSGKSSSDSSYHEVTPTIPNPFAAAPHLGGTRPEDMFYSSLSMNFANNQFKQQQSTDASPSMSLQMQHQQQQQQQDQPMSMDFEKSCLFQNADGSKAADPILCPNVAGLQQGPTGLEDGQCSLAFDSQQQHQRYTTASSTSTANTTSESNYTATCQQPQPQQHSANTFLGIYNMEPIAQPQPAQFDLASLSSQVPLWDVPSGVTWNEWESFLKTNVDTTHASS